MRISFADLYDICMYWSYLFSVTLAQEKPLIEISNGLLEGTLRKSYNGRIFSSFEGVPYAGPPVGEFRFEVCIEQERSK